MSTNTVSRRLARRLACHQALHDRIAGVRVVRTDARPLRPAVRLWLALQLPACFLLLALLMRAVDRSLTLALDASWPL